MLIGGALHTRVGRYEGAYHTMASSVSVLRSLYRRDGQRNGDGAHDLVDALTTEVGGRVDREVFQAVDFWHLIEELGAAGAAARLLERDHDKRLARWRLHLLNVESAALSILGELRDSGRERRERVKLSDT